MVHKNGSTVAAYILRRLHNGNRFYLSKGASRRSKKASEQTPRPLAAVITCPDVEVSIEDLFTLTPGQLIVIQATNCKLGQIGIARLVSAERLHDVSLAVVLVHSSCARMHEQVGSSASRHSDQSEEPTSAQWRVDPLYGPRLEALKARSVLIDAMPKASKMIICAAVLDERNGRVHFVPIEPEN